MRNQAIAQKLLERARELAAQRENLYRVRAYRQAALAILGLQKPLADILLEEGPAGLAAIPGVGAHLAFSLESLVKTGQLLTWSDRPRRPARAG